MSTHPVAKLFYGYVKPLEVLYSEEDNQKEVRWHNAYLREAHGCVGGVYGENDDPAHFLAVEESLHTAERDTVKPIDFLDMGMKSLEKPWDEQLRHAAEHFELDVSGMQPGWYLVCLYF